MDILAAAAISQEQVTSPHTPVRQGDDSGNGSGSPIDINSEAVSLPQSPPIDSASQRHPLGDLNTPGLNTTAEKRPASSSASQKPVKRQKQEKPVRKENTDSKANGHWTDAERETLFDYILGAENDKIFQKFQVNRTAVFKEVAKLLPHRDKAACDSHWTRSMVILKQLV
ncbi:hypothetical protein K435DRAFT_866333 [Dendrothele bispora CBS 962.96]|uniref:Myb-like domain-containing protein n=1 Tax=Dendrothele bispora (strain CBS 962.96) TaxID=1314807 RepID=A0A4S8LH37_DENBC|nr:hypothetical protein K435DRAFT_866333 [Dendrothele bispora CBS 962.96]